MTDKCKEMTLAGHRCTRPASRDGWCKQHWIHPFYAVWMERLDEVVDCLPKCDCQWGDVVSPMQSVWFECESDREPGPDDVGTMSLVCGHCDAATEFMPLASEADVVALCEAWCANLKLGEAAN